LERTFTIIGKKNEPFSPLPLLTGRLDYPVGRKNMKTICLSLLVLTGALLGARGEIFRTDINPALLYYGAFLVAPEPMPDGDRDYLESKKGLEQKLPERFGKIVAGSDNQFRLVRQAAHATAPCDWGIDVSAGPNTMLPHLGRAKAVCRTAQLRAVWALQHGRQADARDELLASFVLGRNAGSDRLLIGALVQNSIESLNYSTVAFHFGQFSPETLKQLVAGFDAAPARCAISACMASEKELGDWALTTLLELQKAHPGDDAKVMAAYRDSGLVTAMSSVGYTNFWPRLVAASEGTSEGVLKLLRETEPLFPRLTEILALPYSEYETQAKQFSADVRLSQNPFWSTFDVFTGWDLGGPRVPARATEFRAEAYLAMVHAAVEYRLHGEAGFKSVMDPFGKGPFEFQRFVFKGVDRGFQLKSAYVGAAAPVVMIFVEKQGAPFQISGAEAGKAVEK
jgi:hypothetical protein